MISAHATSQEAREFLHRLGIWFLSRVQPFCPQKFPSRLILPSVLDLVLHPSRSSDSPVFQTRFLAIDIMYSFSVVFSFLCLREQEWKPTSCIPLIGWVRKFPLPFFTKTVFFLACSCAPLVSFEEKELWTVIFCIYSFCWKARSFG